MAMSCVHLLFLLLIACLIIPASIAAPHNLRQFPFDVAVPDDAPAPETPTTYFEVDRPLRPPPGSSGPCSTFLLSHSFASTYGKPPVTAVYSPPSCLVAAGGSAAAISLAVLEWRATCRGVQFDRIFGVWLSGAELLRSCTAEPRHNGIVWSVSKDATKYASLFAAGNSTLAVYLGNVVDDQYTGVYHANLTLHLYFRVPATKPPAPAMAPADLIVPISRSLPLSDGLWFQIQNAVDVEPASLTLPSNAYRAVLEVYVSFHGQDEFWYTDTPDGNGPFREVTIRVDGDLVGAVWPFPVIYTGGINPLLWRPVTGISSFNLPTYDIELTPFLGKMLDGKAHELGFAVTNAVEVWYVDANLHLWLDPRSTATTGGLISYDAPLLAANTTSQFVGPNGQHHTTASRRITATGWVKSTSYGMVTTNATQTFTFENTNELTDNGNAETVNQTTVTYAGVRSTGHGAGVLYSQQTQRSFPLYYVAVLQEETAHTSNVSYTVARGYHETTTAAAGRWSAGKGYRRRSLRNTQNAGVEVAMLDGKPAGASWGTRQTYRHEASDGCYFRNVTSSGYDVVSNQSNEACLKGSAAGVAAGGGESGRGELVRN